MTVSPSPEDLARSLNITPDELFNFLNFNRSKNPTIPNITTPIILNGTQITQGGICHDYCDNDMRAIFEEYKIEYHGWITLVVSI